MADFSHLAKLHVTEASEAEYIFEDIWGEPSIWFRPATDANADFLNERVRLAVARAEADQKESKRTRREKILSSERLEEDRRQDVILLAKTCALRWGTPPLDLNGKEVEFSPENALDFLNALPSYMIDPLRGWAQNPYSFVNRDAAKPGWADSLGKPSPSA